MQAILLILALLTSSLTFAAAKGHLSSFIHENKEVFECFQEFSYIANTNNTSSTNPSINLAEFSKGIDRKNRKTIRGNIAFLGNSNRKIFFYTNLNGLKNQYITHRWMYQKNNDSQWRTMAEIDFEVKANRWRVWSSKNLWLTWLGKWKVSVLDKETQNIFYQKTFEYLSEKTLQNYCS